MRFFDRLRYGMARFMEGRYGMDPLNRVLFFVYFGLLIAGMVLSRLQLRLAYVIVYLLELFVLFAFLYRAFSRNHYKRRAENNSFLSFFSSIKAYFKLRQAKWRDRKTHVYRKCPNCRAVLRLPKKRGKHVCCCPKCRRDFSVTVH